MSMRSRCLDRDIEVARCNCSIARKELDIRAVENWRWGPDSCLQLQQRLAASSAAGAFSAAVKTAAACLWLCVVDEHDAFPAEALKVNLGLEDHSGRTLFHTEIHDSCCRVRRVNTCRFYDIPP